MLKLICELFGKRKLTDKCYEGHNCFAYEKNIKIDKKYISKCCVNCIHSELRME